MAGAQTAPEGSVPDEGGATAALTPPSTSPGAPPVAGSGREASDAPAAHDDLPARHAAWLRQLAQPHRRALGWAAALPLVSAGLLLWQAWILSRVLDAAIVQGVARDALVPDVLWVVALIVARAALAGVAERCAQQAAEQLRGRLRRRLYDAMLAAGPSWSRTRHSGELAYLVTGQVDALDGYFARYLPAMWSAALVPLVFAVALLPVDVVAGALLLFTLPMIPLFMALVGWGAEAASRRHQDAMTRLSGFFVDRVRGMLTLRLYGQADAQADTVQTAAGQLYARTMAVMRLAFLSSAVLEFFAALGVAGMAVYIGLSYLGMLDLRLSPFTLQAGLFCLLMAPEAYLPLRQFAAHYHDRVAARAAVAQMAQTLSPLPLPVNHLPANAAFAGEAAGHAASASGAFASEASPGGWPSDATPALVGAPALWIGPAAMPPMLREAIPAEGWTLAAGEHAALVGASGSGKTTVLETLCGLREARAGVRINGTPLAMWSLPALREHVVLISQRPYLHAGSLADNIRLGRVQATDAQVREAARQAGVLAYADRWPLGLETPIGHHGQGLSGGQRQRLALARLYLRDPQLILLDEPTAHLDEDTAAEVLDAVFAFARGRSLLMATHAPSAAARCAQVWTLSPVAGAAS